MMTVNIARRLRLAICPRENGWAVSVEDPGRVVKNYVFHTVEGVVSFVLTVLQNEENSDE